LDSSALGHFGQYISSAAGEQVDISEFAPYYQYRPCHPWYHATTPRVQVVIMAVGTPPAQQQRLKQELENDTRDVADLWNEALKSYKGWFLHV